MKIVIDTVESASSTMNIAAISLALISNPSAAWVLLNTILIIYFLPLGYQILTPGIVKICKAMSNLQGNTNILTMIFNIDNSSNLLNNAKKIGINSSSILVNLGSDVTLFLAIVISYPFVLLLSKYNLGFLREKFLVIKKCYKYSLFIRFLIQRNLQIGIFSLMSFESVISIKNEENLDFESIISKALSFILVVVNI